MKEFLDGIKEKAKEFVKEVKENNKGNRTELMLTGAFVAVFLVLSVPKAVKETSGGRIQTDSEQTEFRETGADMEEDALESDGFDLGRNDTEEQSEESSDRKNEKASEVWMESGTYRPEGTDDSRDTENTEGETGADRSDQEKAGMTETDALDLEALGREWKRLQARYGEAFLFPMAAASTDQDICPLPELKNTMQLRGYDAVLQWKPEQTLQNLKQLLEEQIEGYDGEWSVYCKNLSTEESFVIRDTPMKSASVMKLFIMGTVYTAFESGELSRTDEIMELLHNMIVYSDNGSSNQLLAKLGNGSYADGIAKVDAFIESHGFSGMTVEYNGFNDPETNTSDDNFNQVAAKDCGKLLEDIYRRTWVNRAVSNEIESLLLSQDTRYKIPAGLPEDVLCGNKTGEMDTTENDAAIIYGKDCDYILVVLSSDWSSKDQAISRIAELSRLTYSYLNPETAE